MADAAAGAGVIAARLCYYAAQNGPVPNVKTMDAERWRRIREVLAEALLLPVEKRAAFLDGACQDASDRPEIEALMAAAEAPAWFDQPAIPRDSELPEAQTDVGPYHIVEKIGQGGMGTVYKAIDTRLDRTVALKVISRADGSPADRARFVREAKAASALNHPNIVTIYEYDSAEGRDFIAMEFVAGRTLREMIETREAPLSKGLEYARQVARGLARAHGAGIIHRDLKTGNIMVNSEGVAKILDFGLARHGETQQAGPDDETALTRTGAILGTPGYMSPEQVWGEKVDHRTDIFSFGVVLYEIACGERPFRGDDPHKTMLQVAVTEPKPVSEVNRDVPETLAALIAACLKRKPDDRPQSMAEVETRLGDILAQGLEARKGLSRRSVLAAGAIIAAAFGGGIWYTRERAAAAGETAVDCTLEAQQVRDGEPVGEPRVARVSDVFEGVWRFRLRALPAQPGYLYLVDEGPDRTGEIQLNLLYPAPAPPGAGPRAPQPGGESVETNWYRLEGSSGTERLWIVWAKQPVEELEGGAGDATWAGRARAWLAQLRPTNVMSGEVKLHGGQPVLSAVLELKHH